VLASASPRRRELLGRLVDAFEVVPADADETPPEGAGPQEAAVAIARRKALVVLARTGGVVLAADTIVAATDGEFLGKPADADDARRILGKLSGTTHRVVTGVVVADADGVRTASDTTLVTMRNLSPREIDDYVATGECFDKAGAYAIQETADRFVTRLEGSFTNVVGLPLETVAPLLRSAGVALLP